MIRAMLVFHTQHEKVRRSATLNRYPILAEIEKMVTSFESTEHASAIMHGNRIGDFKRYGYKRRRQQNFQWSQIMSELSYPKLAG